MMVVTLFGVTLFAVEEYIILSLLHVSVSDRKPSSTDRRDTWTTTGFLLCPQCRDAGGSMVIHAFGGYYGLAISWVLYRPNLHQSKRLNGSVYHSDVFAMIGASPLSPAALAARANDLLTCLSSCRDSVPVDVLAQFQRSHHRPRRRPAQNSHQHVPGSGFLCSHHGGDFQHVPEEREAGHGTRRRTHDLSRRTSADALTCSSSQVHIQNATLAGGVAMGTSAEFMITPYGALIVGFLCGIISTFGYLFISVSPRTIAAHVRVRCVGL